LTFEGLSLSFAIQKDFSKAEVERLIEAFGDALLAAHEFEGATAPNPPVGCVILDIYGNELATAAHQKAGEPHAEALAIAACEQEGVIQRIHTIIVTLEPCNHHGRTPPCAAAILKTPAKEVWIGAADPNPHVAGGGAATLRAAGVEVFQWADVSSDLANLAARLIAPFAKHKLTGLPWVTVKQALTLEGSMIPPAGQKTFTSPSSLRLAHMLRKRADAIITGSGTVLADAPLFNVRHVEDHAGKRRALAVLDRRRRVSQSYFTDAAQRGFDVVQAQSIEETLQKLGAAGALEVLVEAGPQLTKSILASGQWDEHVIIQQTDGADRISIIENTEEGDHVLRHH
jgi:diaminohydroxyphosphoribosylaminopyrimidine deaminase / 5-amino-6-(5-phosphoribosylamino)uracil reductase